MPPFVLWLLRIAGYTEPARTTDDDIQRAREARRKTEQLVRDVAELEEALMRRRDDRN